MFAPGSKTRRTERSARKNHGASGAGVLSSLVGADGLVELPEDMTEIEAGSTVNFLPFSEVLG